MLAVFAVSRLAGIGAFWFSVDQFYYFVSSSLSLSLSLSLSVDVWWKVKNSLCVFMHKEDTNTVDDEAQFVFSTITVRRSAFLLPVFGFFFFRNLFQFVRSFSRAPK